MNNRDLGTQLLADHWLRTLTEGAQVWWNDPDRNLSTGLYTISMIKSELGRVESLQDLLCINNEAGSFAEVLASELSPSNMEALYPKNDWIYAITNGDTVLGYAEWLVHQAESNAVPLPKTSQIDRYKSSVTMLAEPPVLALECPEQTGTDYLLDDAALSCWVRVGNISVHIQRTENAVIASLFPKGVEGDGEIDSAQAYIADAADLIAEYGSASVTSLG